MTERSDGDGGLLLEIADFLARFVAYPSDAAHVAHVLWIAHTHIMDAWESTPRIAFLSPEPGSGKTRAIEITELLVPRPVEAVNGTPAYLFRKVADKDGRPTILFDEIDTVFGPKAKDNEEIRGLLNAGHRRGAVAGRCVVKGKLIETEEIEAYGALALAGLGGLPDTILSRSIVIRMRRRGPDEMVEPYRRRVHRSEGEALRERLVTWTASIGTRAGSAWPDMPASIVDRDADVWEPLLTIADLAGGEWPERARVSAVTLVTASKAGTPSLGVRLLADIRALFDSQRDLPGMSDSDQIATDKLLKGLMDLDESPWGDLRGKPLDARGLAQRLRAYEVKPTTIRLGAVTAKGYRRSDFLDAWQRYLPTSPVTASEANPPAYPKDRCNSDITQREPLCAAAYGCVTSVTAETKATTPHGANGRNPRPAAPSRKMILAPDENGDEVPGWEDL